ncbi:MAG: lysozyme inhibitor LprI family protein [Pseudomonadota bacterium]
MRAAFVAIALLAAGPVQAAQDLVERIEACLGRIGDPGEHPELCMGLHVNDCIRTAAGAAPGGEALCIEEEAAAWMRLLNTEYAILDAELGDEQRTALRDAQRKWMAFLQSDCKFPLLFEEGALARPWAADCRLQHTARRAMELRGYLDYLAYTQ